MVVDADDALDETTSLVSVLDDEYPRNLRRIYNRPPFLFVRGALDNTDERSVAVVGTRRASPDGLSQAAHLAGELARRGVTVVSGLARGIDTAAHTAALDAGGRTLAVMGTGIDRVYPAENAELAQRIPEQGALVSQFWPARRELPSAQRREQRDRSGHRRCRGRMGRAERGCRRASRWNTGSDSSSSSRSSYRRNGPSATHSALARRS
jgi:DNA protecting protein DprA